MANELRDLLLQLNEEPEEKVPEHEALAKCFSLASYNEVSRFAQEHAYVEGVEEIASVMPDYREVFEGGKKAILDEYSPELDKLAADEEKIRNKEALANKLVRYGVIGLIGGWVLCLVFSGIKANVLTQFLATAFGLIGIASVIAIPAGFIGRVFFKKMATEQHKKYMKVFKEAKEAASERMAYLEAKNQEVRQKIDAAWLVSLDPIERQGVLTRRQQEQQHKEMMAQQKRHQDALQEEQARIRSATEELLEYERDREERRLEQEARWYRGL